MTRVAQPGLLLFACTHTYKWWTKKNCWDMFFGWDTRIVPWCDTVRTRFLPPKGGRVAARETRGVEKHIKGEQDEDRSSFNAHAHGPGPTPPGRHTNTGRPVSTRSREPNQTGLHAACRTGLTHAERPCHTITHRHGLHDMTLTPACHCGAAPCNRHAHTHDCYTAPLPESIPPPPSWWGVDAPPASTPRRARTTRPQLASSSSPSHARFCTRTTSAAITHTRRRTRTAPASPSSSSRGRTCPRPTAVAPTRARARPCPASASSSRASRGRTHPCRTTAP